MNYDEAKNFLYNGDGTTPKQNREIANKFNTLYMMITDDKIQEGLSLIKELTLCDDNTAKLLWVDLKCDFGTTENNAILQAREERKKEKLVQDYKYRKNAECPYCHSKNTNKITTTSKVMNTAVFGIFGTKRYKQWHCNNCGSDF